MSLNKSYGGGAQVAVKTSIHTALNAGSSAAPTSSTGSQVDRHATLVDGTTLPRYYSCAAVVSGLFSAASSQQKMTIGIGVQHSSDGTSWDNYSTANNATVSFGATSSGNVANTTAGEEQGEGQMNINLVSARRYLRILLDAPTVVGASSSGSVLSVQGNFVFTGADELP